MSKPKKFVPEIGMEDARIIFRNFRGEEQRYNPSGKRNFCVVIPEEMEEKLIADGWNIKYLAPRDEDDRKTAYLQVAVSYDNYPPAVYMISNGRKTLLGPETIELLDRAEIENVDLVISPYVWELSGGSGVKAYLKEMYVTVRVSRFAEKYADM